jgi:hypothetical protein
VRRCIVGAVVRTWDDAGTLNGRTRTLRRMISTSWGVATGGRGLALWLQGRARTVTVVLAVTVAAQGRSLGAACIILVC